MYYIPISFFIYLYSHCMSYLLGKLKNYYEIKFKINLKTGADKYLTDKVYLEFVPFPMVLNRLFLVYLGKFICILSKVSTINKDPFLTSISLFSNYDLGGYSNLEGE